MAAQYIQTSAIFQNDIISFPLHNREYAQTVCACNGSCCTGNQCAARVLGDISRFTTGVHLQSALLINGGILSHRPFLHHLPATVVNHRIQCQPVLMHILVPSLQPGIMCLSVHRLVTTCVNEGVTGQS